VDLTHTIHYENSRQHVIGVIDLATLMRAEECLEFAGRPCRPRRLQEKTEDELLNRDIA